MAKPTATTEQSGAKVLLLGDSSATPVAATPVAIAVATAGGDTVNYPAGFLGIATHKEGQAVASPGGFTTSAAPVVLVAGDNGTNAIPLQLDGSGNLKVDVAAHTGPTTVSDGGGSLTVDGTVAISGTVPISAASLPLPTSAATEATLSSINSKLAGTLTVTGGGGGTQYTEDAPSAADPTGTAPILVRQDTPAGITSTDGDSIAQRGTNYGAAYVTLLDTAGSPVSIGGGTQYTEDAAAAADPIGNMSMAVRADTPSAVTTTDGDNIALRATNKGELYVKHLDPIPVTDNSGSLTVDGTVAATQSGTWNVGTVTTLSTITNVVHVDDNALSLSVDDNGGSLTVDGTVAVSGTVTTSETHAAAIQTAVELIDDTVVAQGTAIGTVKNSLMGGSVSSSAPTYTTATINPLSMTTAGSLRTSVAEALPAGTNAIGKLALNDGVDIGDVSINAAIPTGSNIIGRVGVDQTTPGTSNAVSLAQIGATTVATGNGIAGTGVQRVTIASDNSSVPVTEASGAAIKTAVELIDDMVVAQGSALGTYKQVLVGGSVATSAPTYSTGTIQPPSMTVNGSLRVAADALPTGTNVIGKVGIDQTTVGTTNAVSLAQLGANTVSTGNGTAGTGTLRVSIASDSTGQVALASGTNGIGKLTANAGVNIGDVNIVPATSGGLTISRTISAATTNATSVKGSAGQVYGWAIFNTNAAVRYLKIYNKATSPTVGTDVPVLTIPIPAGGGSNINLTSGLALGTGIGLALTTGATDADTGAVAANEIIVNLFYK